MGEGRVLLLGESNPGCSGWRLRRILGLSEDQYLTLHRANLCEGAWSKANAQKRAFELLDPQAPWKVMVLLGRKVTETFEKLALDDVELVAFSTRVCCPGMQLVALPHPSGRNAGLWNPKARDRSRQILRALAPEVPWGSVDAEEATA